MATKKKAKKKQTKTEKIVRQAFHEVEEEKIPRKQKVAIALSKARKRGAKVQPKHKRKKK